MQKYFKLTAGSCGFAANFIDIYERFVLQLGDAHIDWRILKQIAKVRSIRKHGADAQLLEHNNYFNVF